MTYISVRLYISNRKQKTEGIAKIFELFGFV